ncbi:low molecular weight phosphotyrosine protein phosphatase [Histomonas meleagridis]|uniref:low molecular weight phosphotyrosine protein phosphatase n=1 Tax=Histomonas meleagridis TaxID=135588 RepID=UPI00355A5851|nr:low molecular weight phosphotyrosine protein phosphatase [Histomonas meleagridis]KAH0801032.1 low molecular weight phosphotyrosine protein phosphatase [Histomonas meleagridis]
MSMQKSVLFVCLGNICRSPACEGICRSIVNGSIKVDSAGTCSFHVGQSPDSRSENVCKKNGVDISHQRARQIKNSDWDTFDVIAALDQSVYQTLEYQKPKNAKASLVLFNPPEGIDDPYYGGDNGFQIMFDNIKAAMPGFLKDNGLI